ncbi:hypothetical protein, partial [Staphylococcus pasteuri_A]
TPVRISIKKRAKKLNYEDLISPRRPRRGFSFCTTASDNSVNDVLGVSRSQPARYAHWFMMMGCPPELILTEQSRLTQVNADKQF